MKERERERERERKKERKKEKRHFLAAFGWKNKHLCIYREEAICRKNNLGKGR